MARSADYGTPEGNFFLPPLSFRLKDQAGKVRLYVGGCDCGLDGAYFQPYGCRSYSSGLYLIVLVLFYPYQAIHVMCVITTMFHPFKADTYSTAKHGAESLFRHPLCFDAR